MELSEYNRLLKERNALRGSNNTIPPRGSKKRVLYDKIGDDLVKAVFDAKKQEAV